MSTAQEILNVMHNQMKMTNSDLGDYLGVPREYISRIRHGNMEAKEQLEEKVIQLYNDVINHEHPFSNSIRMAAEQKRTETIEEETETYEDNYDFEDAGFISPFWLLVIGCILLFLIVTIIARLIERARRVPTQ
jgi:hypothetical protein